MKNARILQAVGLTLSCLGALVCADTAHAASYSWTGAVSNEWNNSKNWSPVGVPKGSDSVTIVGKKKRSTSLHAPRLSMGLLGVPLVTINGSITINGPLNLVNVNLGETGDLTINSPITAVNSVLTGKTITINSPVTATDCVLKADHATISSLGSLTLASNGGTGNVVSGECGNSGQIVWASGDLELNADFENKDNGTFMMQSNGTLSGTEATSQCSSTGSVIRTGSDGPAQIDIPFVNTGPLVVQDGTLEFTQPFEQSDGSTNLDGGDIVAPAGFHVSGGQVQGIGSITGDVVNDGGEFRPGHSPGSVTINGNYTQTDNGSLYMELGGNDPGVTYDQMTVNGNLSLAGTLNIVPYNSYVPTDGVSFELFDFYSTDGDFSTVNVQFPSNVSMDTTVTPMSYIAIAQVSSGDKTAPTVVTKTPSANTAYALLTSASGTASDTSGIASVTARLYRYPTAATGAGYWAGGTAWNSSYNASANERAATGTTSWSLTLPSLTYGPYLILPTAKDKAGNHSSSSGNYFLKSNGTSSLSMSSSKATASNSTIQLTFSGALDTTIAKDINHYVVTLNSASGTKLTVQSATISGNTITLSLARGAMATGNKVIVTWSNLFDSTGKLLSGQSSAITVQ